MRFSAIIVNYASWPLTRRCIEALHEASRDDLEVIVVDNDPAEPPRLSPREFGVRLLRNPENAGFAGGCNRGIAAASGDLVVLINPDAVVERGFFEVVEGYFAGAPETGIAGPRVLDEDGAVQLSARREVGALSGLLGRTSLLTRLFPKSPLVRSQFPALAGSGAPAEVDWVSGACMIARSRVLGELGGLDERFFMYFEDADLCRRARAAGWRVAYLPQATVVHRAGGSSGDSARAVWRLHKSAFLYHRKHGPRGPLGLYSIPVLAGLAARALVKLAAGYLGRPRD